MIMTSFYSFFYSFMRVLIAPYFAIFRNYRWKVYKPKSKTYLVLTNHNTNYDFFLAGLCLRKSMRFVASEQIMRSGFAGKIVKLLADPIPRKKGDDASDTVKMIVSRLQSGSNVCMMVEGNRSFSGETGWISPNNIKLIRDSGAGLINWVVHGGYFVNPRWSRKQRRGRMWGETVRELTPEEISSMSDDEILRIIRNDIYVDAYADQEKHSYKYQTRNRAENLETALFICPECHKMNSMMSAGNTFSCNECGLNLFFNEYCYFENTSQKNDPLFKDILSWSRWQVSFIKSSSSDIITSQQRNIFHDDGIKLSRIIPGTGTEPIDEGTLSMDFDRICFHGKDTYYFNLNDISHLSIFTMNTILFRTESDYYELRSSRPYSALKYLICWRLFQGKDYV